jgi:hypothetical protein
MMDVIFQLNLELLLISDCPSGKLKSKITLLSIESFFVTVFKGEIFKLQLKGFFSNGPIIASYEASFYKYFISKEFYLGKKIELSYPKVDDLVGIIKEKGPDCLIFKKDLKKACRQIPVGSFNTSLIKQLSKVKVKTLVSN